MIKGPKNAVPTPRGWVSSKGELLKSQRITQEQIDEWNGVTVQDTAPVVEVVEAVVEAQDEESAEVEVETVEETVEDKPKKSKRRWGFSKK